MILIKVNIVFDVVVDIHKAYNPWYIMLNMCLDFRPVTNRCSVKNG